VKGSGLGATITQSRPDAARVSRRMPLARRTTLLGSRAPVKSANPGKGAGCELQHARASLGANLRMQV
jgi:hypothetical protein